MKIQQFKNSPGELWSYRRGLNLLVLRNKIKYKSFPHPRPSVQSKVHTRPLAGPVTVDTDKNTKGDVLKSLQNHRVERNKSNLSDTKSNLSVEIYQNRYSVEAQGALPTSHPQRQKCG